VEVLAPEPAKAIDDAVAVRPLRYARRPRLFFGAGAPDNLLGGVPGMRRVRAWSQIPSFVGRLGAACWSRSRGWEGVISHWLVPCGVVGSALARGLPHLAIAHSSDVHLLVRVPRADLLLQMLARPRNALVLTSEALREPLARRARARSERQLIERARVVRMGVTPAGASRRLTHRTRGQRLRLIFIGRLVRLKGVDLLLDAAAGLPVELRIVGDGPERSTLEQLARRLELHACFLGELGRSDAWKQLVDADVLALPSRVLPDGRTDSAPLVLMEALFAGVPVIASRVGAVSSLVRHDAEGLIVPPGDRGALRQAIGHLVQRPQTVERLARAARARGPMLGWDRVGEELEQQLLSL
jgi:glycosyltransferase involved in cell wall biosynthesis